MSEPDPKYSKRYEELMRNAGERRRLLSAQMLENERRFRLERGRRKLEGAARVERDLREHAEAMHLARRIERELASLEKRRDATDVAEERILLKAEIVHLRTLKGNLALRSKRHPGRRPKRRPPEAGIAVPAVPPKGPLPRQGGAEAPLNFE